MIRISFSAVFKLVTSAVMAFGLTSAASAACPSNTPEPGCVRFNMITYASFNGYTTNPTQSQQQWFDQHFWRMRTSTPYWDANLSWFPGADIYEDLYGVLPTDPMVVQHPDWIMHDVNGNLLFIPWGCSNGICSRYAGDFTNPAFRNYWISGFASDLQPGYAGLWIDDVNMNLTVSNGANVITPPVDPATGNAMTQTAWEQYMVVFLQQIRAAFPNAEIYHNSVWFAGSRPAGFDPNIEAQIKAADFINVERGFSDSGLTGGTGSWSVNALMAYEDQVHALGTNIEVQPDEFNGEYDLAGYFIMWTPGDSFANIQVTPSNWPAYYDVQLGSPLGARYMWQGLMRRDYSNGIALMSFPSSPTVTVTPAGTFQDAWGNPVSSVTLAAGQGSVLVGPPYFGNGPTGLDINSGGPTVLNFEADTMVSGGFSDSFTQNVDLTQVVSPAPLAVYQDRRVGYQNGTGFTYTIPNLVAGNLYELRLHFADPYATVPGQRLFNMVINGYAAANNFDIIGLSGGQFTAYVFDYWLKPNSNNQIVINFQQGPTTLGPMVNGIELLP